MTVTVQKHAESDSIEGLPPSMWGTHSDDFDRLPAEALDVVEVIRARPTSEMKTFDEVDWDEVYGSSTGD